MTESASPPNSLSNKRETIYKFLKHHQIEMIDEALKAVGDYGEVRLIIEKGRLRFLVTQKSFDTQKWQPGALDNGSH